MATNKGDVKSKMEDYEVVEQIKAGPLGASFLVQHKIEKKKYVLKKIRLPKQTEKSKRTPQQEVSAIAKLKNPYLVDCKDAWVDKGDYGYIVSSYCEGGNIAEMIKKAKGTLFSEEKLCKWLTRLLLAVDYLHSKRVAHGDIKCSNILFTKDNDIRLGDYGLGKLCDMKDIASSVTAVGSPNFMSPELLEDMPYGYKSDIWSLGCCMFEIAAHQPAFKAPDKAGLVYKINRSIFSPLPLVYSSTMKQIIKSMLRKCPEHRPTAADLLRHPYLQPFLLQCRNPSSVFLPIFPVTNPQEKTPRKSPSKKLSGSRDGSSNSELATNLLETLSTMVRNADARAVTFLDVDKPPSTSSAEDKLVNELIRVMDICDTKVIENSKDEKMASDLCDLNGSKELKPEDEVADIKGTLEGRSSSHGDEMAARSSQPLQEVHLRSVDSKSFSSKEGTGTDAEAVGEGYLRTLVESTSGYPKAEQTVDKCSSSTSEEPEVGTRFSTEKGSNGIHRHVDDLFSSDGNGGLLPSKDENRMKSDTVNSSLRAERDDADHFNIRAPNYVPPLSAPSQIVGDESKGKTEGPTLQRADALESLLELCAQLLKLDKHEELANVLKPFGGEAMSSRETAIWLTKSLLSTHKLNGGS